NLGTNTVLGLTEAELDRISAGTLIVGRNDAAAAGAVTVSSPIDLTTASTPGGFTVPTLHLLSGSGVSETGAGNLTVTNLAVDAGTGTVVLQAGSVGAADNPLSVIGAAAVRGTGGVTLIGDNLSLGATSAVNAGGAAAVLEPSQPGTLINLGGADGANTLGLT